jgi:hypothetical protein
LCNACFFIIRIDDILLIKSVQALNEDHNQTASVAPVAPSGLPEGWHRVSGVRKLGKMAGSAYFVVKPPDEPALRSQKELDQYTERLGLANLSLKGPVTKASLRPPKSDVIPARKKVPAEKKEPDFDIFLEKLSKPGLSAKEESALLSGLVKEKRKKLIIQLVIRMALDGDKGKSNVFKMLAKKFKNEIEKARIEGAAKKVKKIFKSAETVDSSSEDDDEDQSKMPGCETNPTR